MKKLFFIVLGFVSVLAGIGQNKKNYFEINLGVQNLQNKNIYTIHQNDGCMMGAFSLTNIKEESLNLPTFSVLRYHHTRIKDLSFISGIGVNQKGFLETATRVYYENPAIVDNYSLKRIMTYASLQFGVNYTFLTYENVELSISQMVYSETTLPICSMQNYEFQKDAYSSATFLKIVVLIDKNSALIIKPFFQTALSNYSKDRTDFNGNLLANNYRPFGYGLSLGFSF